MNSIPGPLVKNPFVPMVLIADDQETIRFTLQEVFSEQVSNIYTASTCEEARDLCVQYPINIAFIDLNMPQMGGLALFKEIKSINPQIMVNILTGQDNSAGVDDLLNDGVFDFILKPATFDRLQVCLDRCLRRLP